MSLDDVELEIYYLSSRLEMFLRLKEMYEREQLFVPHFGSNNSLDTMYPSIDKVRI